MINLSTYRFSDGTNRGMRRAYSDLISNYVADHIDLVLASNYQYYLDTVSARATKLLPERK